MVTQLVPIAGEEQDERVGGGIQDARLDQPPALIEQAPDQLLRLVDGVRAAFRCAEPRLEARYVWIGIEADHGDAGTPQAAHRSESGVEEAKHEGG